MKNPIRVILFLFFILFFLSCSHDTFHYSGIVLGDTHHSENILRFIAIGDAGTGGLPGGGNQQMVADDLAAISDPASGNAVDFLLYLGDNFYEDGVSSISDPLWDSAYRNIYDFTRLPLFYAVAGNHDYHGNVLAQIDYSRTDPTWNMPSLSYAFSFILDDGTRIEFLGIDTEILVTGGIIAEAHWSWIEERLTTVSGGNTVVYGHHPVYSAGTHGDTDLLVRRLHPLLVSHGVDLYLAGHDHNLEVRSEIDGVSYVISGAGGKLRAITAEGKSLYAASVPGVVIIEVDASGFTLSVRDSAGATFPYTGTFPWN